MVGKDHRKSKVGRKAEKRSKAEKKKKGVVTDEERKQNPRAFTYQSAGRAKAQRARTAEKDQRRLHGAKRERALGRAVAPAGGRPAASAARQQLP